MQHSKTSRIILVLFVSVAGLRPCRGWSQARVAKPASAVATARAEISAGKLDDAEKTLWNLLSSDPQQSEALTLLGIIRGRQKRYAEAEALFRRVLELDAKSVIARRNLASTLIAQNKQDAAIEQYTKVVELVPRDNGAKIELARLYIAAGQFNNALSLLDRIPKGQLPPEAIPAKAASLLGIGRREDAAALIPTVQRSPSIEAELAEVFLDADAPDLAMKAITEAFSQTSHPSSRLYYLRGLALQTKGEPKAALKSLGEALTRDPESVQILMAMARIEASQNKHADSLALLKRAHTLQPDSPEVLRPLIVESIKAGEPRTASRAAHVLVASNPENLDDVYLASAAMLEGQDYPSASAILSKYVAERPDDSKGFLGLGIAELAQQHYPEARKALERSIQIDPALADAEYQLGVLADREGALPQAMQHFERAVQLQPNHAKALANLGGQYLHAGDAERARDVLQRSILADPNNAKAQYDLALALAKLGRTQEAKEHMDRSRTLQTAEELGKTPPVSKKPE